MARFGAMLAVVAGGALCGLAVVFYLMSGGIAWLVVLSALCGVLTTQGIMAREVLMPHIGLVLHLDDWFAMADRLALHGVQFDIPPVVRFPGQPGEQRTMFFLDPSGNPIEIKGFKDFEGVFAS